MPQNKKLRQCESESGKTQTNYKLELLQPNGLKFIIKKMTPEEYKEFKNMKIV